jgi:hypothetical protein
MTEVRRADPAARKQAFVIFIFGALIGALLLVVFEHYRISFREWLFSEPQKSAQRVKLVFLVSGGLLSAPLFAFAAYLWLLGARVLRASQFPPEGYRVIRDTPVVSGRAARFRGRGLKVLALLLVGAAAILCLLLWRLASILGRVVVV